MLRLFGSQFTIEQLPFKIQPIKCDPIEREEKYNPMKATDSNRPIRQARFSYTHGGRATVVRQTLLLMTLLLLLGGIPTLFAAQVNGKLSPELSPGARVDRLAPFQFSPDGRHLLYTIEDSFSDTLHLVNLTTRETRRIAYASAGKFTPDGQTILFYGAEDITVGNAVGLYRVSLDGGAAVRIADGGETFDITPDGQTVVYRDQMDDSLRATPLIGGPIVELGDKLVREDRNSEIIQRPQAFTIAADGTRVYFGAYLTEPSSGTDSPPAELFVVPITGGPAVSLTPGVDLRPWHLLSNTTNAPIQDYRYFEVVADDQYLLFYADHEVEDQIELYSVPTGGGPFVKLNPPLSDAEFRVQRAQVSPDQQHLIIYTDQPDRNQDMHLVPVGGGEPILVSKTGYGLFSFDSQDVIYYDWGAERFYSMPLTGETPTPLFDWPLENVPDGFRLAPDGQTLLFQTLPLHSNAGGTYNYFSLALAEAGAEPIRLNPPLPERTEFCCFGYLISPDSSRLLYIADQEVEGKYELYSVPINGGEATKLNLALGNEQDVGSVEDEDGVSGSRRFGTSNSFHFTPDGQRVIYIADQEVDDRFELFIAYNNPRITSTPVEVAVPGLPYRLEVTAEDLDMNGENDLTFMMVNMPGWLVLDDLGNGRALLSGTPTEVDAGPHEVTIEVSNTRGQSATQTFTLTVIEKVAQVYLPLMMNEE